MLLSLYSVGTVSSHGFLSVSPLDIGVAPRGTVTGRRTYDRGGGVVSHCSMQSSPVLEAEFDRAARGERMPPVDMQRYKVSVKSTVALAGLYFT